MPKHGTVAREWVVILKNEWYGLRRPHSQWMRGKIILRFAAISNEATSLEPRGKGGLPVINQIKSNQIQGWNEAKLGLEAVERGALASARSLS
jgi:hypothetical protein